MIFEKTRTILPFLRARRPSERERKRERQGERGRGRGEDTEFEDEEEAALLRSETSRLSAHWLLQLSLTTRAAYRLANDHPSIDRSVEVDGRLSGRDADDAARIDYVSIR